jgi:hypothetical protein
LYNLSKTQGFAFWLGDNFNAVIRSAPQRAA